MIQCDNGNTDTTLYCWRLKSTDRRNVKSDITPKTPLFKSALCTCRRNRPDPEISRPADSEWTFFLFYFFSAGLGGGAFESSLLFGNNFFLFPSSFSLSFPSQPALLFIVKSSVLDIATSSKAPRKAVKHGLRLLLRILIHQSHWLVLRSSRRQPLVIESVEILTCVFTCCLTEEPPCWFLSLPVGEVH